MDDLSLWELTAAIEGYQEANGPKPKVLTDDEFDDLAEVIDRHYGD